MAILCTPGRTLPDYQVSQTDFLTALRTYYHHLDQLEGILRLIEQTPIKQRYFVKPLERLFAHDTIAGQIDRSITVGLPLALQAIEKALEHARLSANAITHCIVTSDTIPGAILAVLDAWLANALGFSSGVRQLTLTQTAGHGGVAALAQAWEYLLAHPSANVLICALDLWSLFEHPENLDVSAFISRASLRDGCVAAVMQGKRKVSGLRLQATNQCLIPGTIPSLQSHLHEQGTHFRTNPEVVPGLTSGLPAVLAFLQEHNSRPADLNFLMTAPGGKRVMDAVISEPGVDQGLLAASRESLREVGHRSRATTFDVLAKLSECYRPREGALGLVLGFGPSSTIEMALGIWREG